jgi:hypothetical protein
LVHTTGRHRFFETPCGIKFFFCFFVLDSFTCELKRSFKSILLIA